MPARKDLVGRWRLVDYRASSGGRSSFPMGEGAQGVLEYSADEVTWQR
ncbi:MAG: hypothetical protein ACT4P3_21965 [Betaproteobacteria bacterium]